MKSIQRRWPSCVLAVAAMLLTSCGGGGSDSAVPQSLVQGTAALGTPIEAGQVRLQCVAGDRSGVTDAQGKYQIDLSGLTLPCLLSVSGGKLDQIDSPWKLSSVISAPGVSNLTPWTHLVVARLLGTNPERAVDQFNAAELSDRLVREKVAQAQAGVRTEMGRLLGAEPHESIDPVTTAFNANLRDGMGALLDQLMNGLRWNNKTLSQAADEMAIGPLQGVEVASSCKPGVLTGFRGVFDDVPVQVPSQPEGGGGGEDGGGAGDGDGDGGAGSGAGGGDGAGAGGSLGQFVNTVVRAERSDGSLLGEAVTDDVKGMVTVVPCRYQGPVRITMKAKPDGSSRYYEESLGRYVPFPAGEEVNAVVPKVTKNLGVTPLTEAAWQYLAARHGADGWKNAEWVVQAQATIGAEFNKYLPKDMQVTDISRLPVVIGVATKAGSIEGTPNGNYGLVSSGLARSAGLMLTGDLSPTLKLVRQLGRDLCDGNIDLACNGVPVLTDATQAAYVPAQFGEVLNRGVGEVSGQCATTEAAKSSFAVTQVSISASPVAGPRGEYFVESYHDRQPIYLLRSDGHVFHWADRQSDATPFLPEVTFNQIFPQSGYYFAGVTGTGEFFSKTSAVDPGAIATQRSFAQATTTAGYISATGHSSQISRLGSGKVAYFPHYDKDDPTERMQTKVIDLSNVVSVSWAQGDDNQGNPGWGLGTNGKDKPTYFALNSAGEVYVWGNDRYGILGDGRPATVGNPTPGTGAPQKVQGLPPVSSIIGISTGAFAIDLAGQVWSWGAIEAEQSLLAGLTDADGGVSTPLLLKQPFEAHGPIQQISCGIGHVCLALTRSGKLLSWGLFGFEDDVIPPELLVPLKKFGVTEVPLPKDRRVTYLGSSQDMVYALLDDGQLVVFPTYPTHPKLIDTRLVVPTLPATSHKGLTCRG